MKDAKDIQNTCFKLNSLQLQALLAGYLYASNEPHIPPVSTSCVFFNSSHYDAIFWDISIFYIKKMRRRQQSIATNKSLDQSFF